MHRTLCMNLGITVYTCAQCTHVGLCNESWRVKTSVSWAECIQCFSCTLTTKTGDRRSRRYDRPHPSCFSFYPFFPVSLPLCVPVYLSVCLPSPRPLSHPSVVCPTTVWRRRLRCSRSFDRSIRAVDQSYLYK